MRPSEWKPLVLNVSLHKQSFAVLDPFRKKQNIFLPCLSVLWFKMHYRCSEMITHRQCTTVRPSPHSLCHLCTWASRFRKAFLESGTSRYADQRRNWNWHTTSWPSWSFSSTDKMKNTSDFTHKLLLLPTSHSSQTFFEARFEIWNTFIQWSGMDMYMWGWMYKMIRHKIFICHYVTRINKIKKGRKSGRIDGLMDEQLKQYGWINDFRQQVRE